MQQAHEENVKSWSVIPTTQNDEVMSSVGPSKTSSAIGLFQRPIMRIESWDLLITPSAMDSG